MPLNSFEASESAEVPRRQMVAALVVQGGRLLMVHNIKHNGLRIEPPGGKVKDGETPEEAVVREVMEELGVAVRVTGKAGVYETQSPEGPFDVHMFICEIMNGEPTTGREPGKIGHFEWFSAEELEALARHAREHGSHLLVPNMQSALSDVRKILEG